MFFVLDVCLSMIYLWNFVDFIFLIDGDGDPAPCSLMEKNLVVDRDVIRVKTGEYTTQLCGDYIVNHYTDQFFFSWLKL